MPTMRAKFLELERTKTKSKKNFSCKAIIFVYHGLMKKRTKTRKLTAGEKGALEHVRMLIAANKGTAPTPNDLAAAMGIGQSAAYSYLWRFRTLGILREHKIAELSD